MDKETLSHYGWVVIVVLIAAVMIAFATPFGTYVGDSVVETVRGFVGVNEQGIDEGNIKNKSDQWADWLENGIDEDETSEPEPDEPDPINPDDLTPYPYTIGIEDPSFLTSLSNIVNTTSGYKFEVILLLDIDLTEIEFTSIGTKTNPFVGTFDFNGHTIYGVSEPLFGYVESSNIKNGQITETTSPLVDYARNTNFENMSVSSGSFKKGILANTISGGTVKNYDFTDCLLPTRSSIFAETVKNNTELENITADGMDFQNDSTYVYGDEITKDMLSTNGLFFIKGKVSINGYNVKP